MHACTCLDTIVTRLHVCMCSTSLLIIAYRALVLNIHACYVSYTQPMLRLSGTHSSTLLLGPVGNTFPFSGALLCAPGTCMYAHLKTALRTREHAIRDKSNHKPRLYTGCVRDEIIPGYHPTIYYHQMLLDVLFVNYVYCIIHSLGTCIIMRSGSKLAWNHSHTQRILESQTSYSYQSTSRWAHESLPGNLPPQ